MANVTTEYRSIVIAYDEAKDVWRFVLDGRERSAESLANAKKAIDAPVKDKKPFTKIEALLGSSYDMRKPSKVTITAVAERASYQREPQFWINKDGIRSKEGADSLFEDSEENLALYAEAETIQAEIDRLEKQISALAKKRKLVKLPKD